MLSPFKSYAARYGSIIAILLISVVQAQPRLKPNLDVAQFQDKANKPYLEIYYSLPEAAVQYAPDNAGAYKCQLLLSLQIYQEQALWASKVWKIEKSIADTAQLRSSQYLVDALSYLIDRPGRYRLVLHVKDANRADRIDSASAEFKVRSFSREKLEVSDLELATAIKPGSATTAAVFAKNAQEVIPNASALFGEGAPELYYYFEAYHLTQNVPGRRYKTLCRIQTTEGKIVEGMGSAYRTKMKRFDSSVEMGMLNIAQLPSGKYRLLYGIADSAETLLASREKDFFVYNPALVANGTHAENAASMANAAGPLNTLDEKVLDDEFARMQYITTLNDKKFYKNLSNPEAKREFIASLWKAAPASDGLAPLVYRQQYLGRAQHAEGLYKSPNRPGWKTDRGRVFIIYGPPNNIERFPSSNTTLPYEIWTYHNLKGQGGVMFVFADRTGFSNYEQIHSDLQGELQDPNWQKLISRGSSSENLIIGVQ